MRFLIALLFWSSLSTSLFAAADGASPDETLAKVEQFFAQKNYKEGFSLLISERREEDVASIPVAKLLAVDPHEVENMVTVGPLQVHGGVSPLIALLIYASREEAYLKMATTLLAKPELKEACNAELKVRLVSIGAMLAMDAAGLALLQALFDHGYHVEGVKDSFGDDPLMFAMYGVYQKTASLDAVQVLAAHTPDLDYRKGGEVRLEMALNSSLNYQQVTDMQRLEVMQILVTAGAKLHFMKAYFLDKLVNILCEEASPKLLPLLEALLVEHAQLNLSVGTWARLWQAVIASASADEGGLGLIESLAKDGMLPTEGAAQASLMQKAITHRDMATGKAVIVFLLTHGVSPSMVSPNGTTVLMMAAGAVDKEERLEILEEVLALNPDLNAQAHDGSTALMAAVQSGHAISAQVVKRLIEAGADASLKNARGVTALGLVCQQAPAKLDASLVSVLLQDIRQLTNEPGLIASFIKNRDTLWPVLDDFASAHQLELSLVLLEALAKCERLPAEDLQFIMAYLDQAFADQRLSDDALERLYELTATSDTLAQWFKGEKQHFVNFLLRREHYVRKLTAMVSRLEVLRDAAVARQAALETTSSGEEAKENEPDTEQTSSEEARCVTCLEPLAASELATEQPSCQICAAKWYSEGGRLDGLGFTLSEQVARERGLEITAEDLYGMGLSSSKVLELEIERLRLRLASVPGWRSCSQSHCFNGKQVGEGDDLYLQCGLCGHSACLSCGFDHHGDCAKEEETRKELVRLAALGRKAPDTSNPQSEDGKFRPCYYCGVLTERIDGCSTMKCPACKHSWDYNYGAPEKHPQYRGSQVHDFKTIEQQYEPLVPAHF